MEPGLNNNDFHFYNSTNLREQSYAFYISWLDSVLKAVIL